MPDCVVKFVSPQWPLNDFADLDKDKRERGSHEGRVAYLNLHQPQHFQSFCLHSLREGTVGGEEQQKRRNFKTQTKLRSL